MRETARVDVDLEARIFADQRTGGSGMVEMNVSEQDGV